MKKKHTIKNGYSDKELERIGKLVVHIGETGHRDRWTVYRMSFMKGIFGGVGGVIGASLVIALLAFILSLLSGVPFVGNIADNLKSLVESSPH